MDNEFKVFKGLKENLPSNRENGSLYYTTDEHDFYIGETRYVKEKEYADQEERITNLEQNQTASMTNDLKKSMIQMYKYIASADTKQAPYAKNVIASVKGMEEFAKLGTGLFIHWGIYAVPAGHFEGINEKGETVNKNITYNCEWSMRDLSIPKVTYKAYESQFTGEKFDTDALAKKVADCGMKYIIITAKHHEGFSLYPTSYGLWDIRTSACRNTVLDELKASCDKYGLKFGLYYSQYWDWMGEGGFGLEYQGKWNGSTNDLYTEAQHIAYCNSAVKEIDEMIRKYDPYVLWYDPGTNYSSKYINIFVNGENEKYSHIITNDRLDYNRNYGDYGTGERTIYVRNKLNFGESCFTLNDTWGYSVNNDSKYFSTEKVFKQFLLYTLSYGQNCLLNVGPKPDGSIPQQQLDMLTNIQNFTESYGKFANYKRINYVSRPKWGYMLQLEGNKILCYVIAKGNTGYSETVIDCISTKNLASVDILTSGATSSYEIANNRVYIHGLELDSNTKVGVIRLNYETEPINIDANLLVANEMLPSRTFVMQNGLTFDFNEYIYTTKGSANKIHKTEFIWDDDTNDYNATLSFSTTSTTDTITLTIKDIETSATTTLTYYNDATTCDDYVNLVKGKRYEVSFNVNSNDASTFKIYGFTFVPKTVVVHPTSVTLDEHNLTMNTGETYQLNATVLPNDATDKSVTWESSDETLATVSNGLVSAIKAGDVTITVKTVDGNLTDSCLIEVDSEEPIIHPTSVTLSESSINVLVNQEHQLLVSVMPTTSTYQAVTWTTSDENIATVEDGIVRGISEGNTTITVSTVDGGLTASCQVAVTIVHVSSISLDKTSVTLIPGFSETLTATVLPTDAINKEVTWSIDDDTIATVTNGVIFAKKQGTATVTATTVDGGYTATCQVTVEAETYDYKFSAVSLDGSADQGDDTSIKLFSDALPNWTLFGYADSSLNDGQADSNATLYQCVVNSSPWTGLRIDADNNNYPIASTPKATLVPRMLAGTDQYINTITGARSSGKPTMSIDTPKHPCCISRNGSVYKYSIDGINWTDFDGQTEAQLARLVDCPLTVAFDYKRSGGQMTSTKYRFLKTDKPVCVALKNQSEYPFYSLYQEYDPTLNS